MRIHILGICGTFMGGLALLARELGIEVEGSDAHVYPPMSTQLEAAGIRLKQGYEPAYLEPAPDLVVVGNAMTRGNPAVEYMLDQKLPYVSGPQWLADALLKERHVLAVSGTHGKTTTTSMLAWILDAAGLAPGFLIGGVAPDFGISARVGGGRHFVIEADEYDSAFFDKRSKFIHYCPNTLVINNIEFDHADIFRDLEDIRRQFNHLIRIVPGSGRILARAADAQIADVLARGCWTPVEYFGVGRGDWQARLLSADGSAFAVSHAGRDQADVCWSLLGRHNVENGLAAIAAAASAGVEPAAACEALSRFSGVRRRLERYAQIDGISLYDDFAHHPTAIKATLSALRQRVGEARILAILEPRSNTMKLGVHRDTLAASLADADQIFIFEPAELGWELGDVAGALADRCWLFDSTAMLIDAVAAAAVAGDHVVIMSNGGFEGLHARLAEWLESARGKR